MSHVFISYSKQDSDFVRYLRSRIQAAGLTVWMDEEIELSGRWWKTIETNIDTCAVFVVVMSPQALKSDWVEREILVAEKARKPIFPVLFKGDVWSRLANIQAEDMRKGINALPSMRFINGLKAHCSPTFTRQISLVIQAGDMMETQADVVAFKYAQKHYGADEHAAIRLTHVAGYPEKDLAPARGEHVIVDTKETLGARYALFVGMTRLRYISYRYLQDFGRDVLRILRDNLPNAEHLAMTIHGPNFGLDEGESLLTQFNGYLEAIYGGMVSPLLQKITIVELNAKRAHRLRQVLQAYLQDHDFEGISQTGEGDNWQVLIAPPEDKVSVETSLDLPKRQSTNALVIMPDGEDADDTFYYGIQGAVHSRGLLCERQSANPTYFDGEMLETIRVAVDDAAVVIVDLTDVTPYILLQLGYAWGRGLPVIVISAGDLPDHFRTGHYITYSRIRELEEGLTHILETLQSGGAI
jgi:hypothetical protein